MIHFNCTGCGRAFSVADKFAGRPVKCRDCGAKLRIPEAEDQAPEPTRVLAEYQAQDDDLQEYSLAEELPSIEPAPQPRITRTRKSSQRRTSKPQRKASFLYTAVGGQLFRVLKVVFMLSVVVICIILFMQHYEEIFPSQHAPTQPKPTSINQPDPEAEAAWAKAEAESAKMDRERQQAADTLDPFVGKIRRFAVAREVGINYADLKGAVVELSASYKEVNWTAARKDSSGVFIATDAKRMLDDYKRALHAWENAIRYSGEELLATSVVRYEMDRDKALGEGDESLKKVLEQYEHLRRMIQH